MDFLKAWKSFSSLLPEVLSIMMFVGISLAILSPETISRLIGAESGPFGIAIALIAGSVTLIPSFVTFPLGAALLKDGAVYAQIASFVSTLMTVGVATLPVEIKYLNKYTAILRNISAPSGQCNISSVKSQISRSYLVENSISEDQFFHTTQKLDFKFTANSRHCPLPGVHTFTVVIWRLM